MKPAQKTRCRPAKAQTRARYRSPSLCLPIFKTSNPLNPHQVRKHLAEQKEALALEHGQRLALLRGARSSLLSERSAIEAQLEQSSSTGAGPADAGGSGFDMNSFVRQLQGQQGAHKARLDRLKRELSEMEAPTRTYPAPAALRPFGAHECAGVIG